MLIFEPRSPGSKVHPDLVVSPPRDRLESNEVRTKLLPLPPLALEDFSRDDELMLAIESNPNSHETDDNSYTEDFSSEEKSSENQARLAEQNYHNQNGPEITVISNSNVAEPSSTIQQNENNSGGYSANTEEDGYRYSDEENTRENGYGGRGKNAITKSTDYKSKRGQNLNYHHDKDVLRDSNLNYPSTSTNQELEEKMRNGMKIRRTFLQ
jgi:hypothetical protein